MPRGPVWPPPRRLRPRHAPVGGPASPESCGPPAASLRMKGLGTGVPAPAQCLRPDARPPASRGPTAAEGCPQPFLERRGRPDRRVPLPDSRGGQAVLPALSACDRRRGALALRGAAARSRLVRVRIQTDPLPFFAHAVHSAAKPAIRLPHPAAAEALGSRPGLDVLLGSWLSAVTRGGAAR